MATTRDDGAGARRRPALLESPASSWLDLQGLHRQREAVMCGGRACERRRSGERTEDGVGRAEEEGSRVVAAAGERGKRGGGGGGGGGKEGRRRGLVESGGDPR